MKIKNNTPELFYAEDVPWFMAIMLFFFIMCFVVPGTLITFQGVWAGLIFVIVGGGLGFGGMVPVRSVLISRLFGVDKFSRANGLLSFFLAPATFWVLITGYIVDTYGSYVTAFQIWTLAFMIAGSVSLIVKLPNYNDEATPSGYQQT